MAGHGHAVQGAILGNGAERRRQVAGRFLAIADALLQVFVRRLERDALVLGNIGGLQVEVAILALPRRVVAERDEIHRAFAHQFLDHRKGGRKGDFEPCMHAMVDEQARPCLDHGADQGAGEIVAAHVAIGRAGREGQRGIGGGDAGRCEPQVEIAQAHFHGHANAGTRLDLALDHVAMHVDHAGHQQQAIALDISLGHRRFADLGDQSILDAQGAARNDAVGKHNAEVREPHRRPPGSLRRPPRGC